MKVYYDIFESKENVLAKFAAAEKDLQGCEIVFASYSEEGYSGEALVILFNAESKTYYEVNGSHCSCHGLEGQWDMEETTLEAIMKRTSPFMDGVVKAHPERYLLTKTVAECGHADGTSHRVSRKM